MVGRRVEVDDAADGVDVDAAGGDVGGHEGPDRAGGELLQRPLPLRLRLVAVDGDGRHPGRAELADDPVGAVLGPAEDDGRLVAGDDVGGQRDAPRRVGLPEQVADLAGLAGVVGHLVAAGLVLVAADDTVDGTVERGREQHGLTLGRGQVEQALDRGQEAHVGHAVGLVEDDDVDRGEVDHPLGDEVLEAARAGDEDVDAAVELGPLRAVADAAVDRHHATTGRPAQRGQLAADLLGQLAGRHEDQAAGLAGPGRADVEREGQAEGQGLARAGRAPGRRCRGRRACRAAWRPGWGRGW